MACNLWVIVHTQKALYSSLKQIRPTKYGLVLGTSPRCLNGTVSTLFDKRVATAAWLYQQGKVEHLVLSGTHDRHYYNEPLAMKKILVKQGIPAEAITLDIEGTNTLASIRRAKKILGIKEMVIITQRFHGYRALYISHCCNVKASVFAAGDVAHPIFTRTSFRELLARVKVLIDLHVLHKHRSNSDG
ncbi:MAG: ElyC/SanA/YdcF family protein [Bacteroidota bacterium]